MEIGLAGVLSSSLVFAGVRWSFAGVRWCSLGARLLSAGVRWFSLKRANWATLRLLGDFKKIFNKHAILIGFPFLEISHINRRREQNLLVFDER